MVQLTQGSNPTYRLATYEDVVDSFFDLSDLGLGADPSAAIATSLRLGTNTGGVSSDSNYESDSSGLVWFSRLGITDVYAE